MTTKKQTAAAKAAPQPETSIHAARHTEQEMEYDPNEARRVLLELQARYGQVGAEERAAFDTLHSHAERIEMGNRTKAPGVLSDGVSWAVQIDQSFTRYPAALDGHYSKERFAYMLDRLVALDQALGGQGTQRDGTGAKRDTAEEREKAARKARNRLIDKLESVAGKRPDERRELDAAIGTAAALGESILKLVKLGRSWLASAEPHTRILCKSAGLTERLLSEALAAGDALTGAAAGAKLAGRQSGTDAPEVNLAEGWVLHEMEEAKRCFDSAHEETRIVPRLSAGRATRSVLGARKTPAADPVAPEQPGDGATPPVAQPASP
jgi:hypothetical protein